MLLSASLTPSFQDCNNSKPQLVMGPTGVTPATLGIGAGAAAGDGSTAAAAAMAVAVAAQQQQQHQHQHQQHHYGSGFMDPAMIKSAPSPDSKGIGTKTRACFSLSVASISSGTFFRITSLGSISDFLGKVMSFPHHGTAVHHHHHHAHPHHHMAQAATMFSPYYGGGGGAGSASSPYMEKAAVAAAAAAAHVANHI